MSYCFTSNGCMTLISFHCAPLRTGRGCKLILCISILLLLSRTMAQITDLQAKNAFPHHSNSSDSKNRSFTCSKTRATSAQGIEEESNELITGGTSFLSSNKDNYFSFKYWCHLYMLQCIQRSVCKIHKFRRPLGFS